MKKIYLHRGALKRKNFDTNENQNINNKIRSTWRKFIVLFPFLKFLEGYKPKNHTKNTIKINLHTLSALNQAVTWGKIRIFRKNRKVQNRKNYFENVYRSKPTLFFKISLVQILKVRNEPKFKKDNWREWKDHLQVHLEIVFLWNILTSEGPELQRKKYQIWNINQKLFKIAFQFI